MMNLRSAAFSATLAALGGAVMLAGCGGAQHSASIPGTQTQGINGTLFGGQSPVTGANISLYRVADDGSSAFLFGGTTTNASGNFNIPFQCGTGDIKAGSLLYVVASGGNPGAASGTNNSALKMMAVLGRCDSLPSTVNINEVTTAAALYALNGYLSIDGRRINAYGRQSSGNLDNITAAFNSALQLVDLPSGTVKSAITSSQPDTTKTLNSFANSLAACVNTTGGDSAQCTLLFQCALPGAVYNSGGNPPACSGGSGSAPTDTLAAGLLVMNNPTRVSAAGLYQSATQNVIFSPTLDAAPSNWTLPTSTGCQETGSNYNCQTGSSEPLYTYQWALNYVASFFKDYPDIFGGGTDLDVEAAHRQGVKGQGVNVVVLDDGIDVRNPDLIGNVNASWLRNFDYPGNSTSEAPWGALNNNAVLAKDDPTPGWPDSGSKPSDMATTTNPTGDAHGTNVAGMILAAQNGQGVMGIAPRSTLGGARYIGMQYVDDTEAFGGGSWSQNAWIFNGSFGSAPTAPPSYDDNGPSNPALRAMVNLRSNNGTALGAVFNKAAGNSFISADGQSCPDIVTKVVSCLNPANDTMNLEPVTVVVGAANAKGVKASYSQASALNWITGMAGEYGDGGKFGEEGTGPSIFSTDFSGCNRGYAINNAQSAPQFMIGGTDTQTQSNPNCNYSSMNGTSAATPTVSGVVALMLQANPRLSWRDVRDILRITAKKIDADYGTDTSRDNGYRASAFSLIRNTFSPEPASSVGLADGNTFVALDYGWQMNAVGIPFSNWYGFGVADAAAAVNMARIYTNYQPAALTVPDFTAVDNLLNGGAFGYGKVTKVATFNVPNALNGPTIAQVDELQLRMSGDFCVGSVGWYVVSPSGTVSVLQTPLNTFYNKGVSSATNYALGSYAFYGEPQASGGSWTVYAVAATPNQNATTACTATSGGSLSQLQYRVITRPVSSPNIRD